MATKTTNHQMYAYKSKSWTLKKHHPSHVLFSNFMSSKMFT